MSFSRGLSLSSGHSYIAHFSRWAITAYSLESSTRFRRQWHDLAPRDPVHNLLVSSRPLFSLVFSNRFCRNLKLFAFHKNPHVTRVSFFFAVCRLIPANCIILYRKMNEAGSCVIEMSNVDLPIESYTRAIVSGKATNVYLHVCTYIWPQVLLQQTDTCSRSVQKVYHMFSPGTQRGILIYFNGREKER